MTFQDVIFCHFFVFLQDIDIFPIEGVALQKATGGAILLETESRAAITNVTFTGNQAKNDGGAIGVIRRSYLNVDSSTFRMNKAARNGGSIFIQYSQANIMSSSFGNETALGGSGGSICSDDVANVTLVKCYFAQCEATYGGSIAIRKDSLLFSRDLIICQSKAVLNGGGLFIFERSKFTAFDLEINSSQSASGGGVYLGEYSELNIQKYTISKCNSTLSGGALSCLESTLTLDDGTVTENLAHFDGAGLHIEQCQATFDNVTIAKNKASGYGGGIFAKLSQVDLHNTGEEDNFAGRLGDFIFTTKSNLNTYFLTLKEQYETDIVLTNSSRGRFHHTYFVTENTFCPVLFVNDSMIVIQNVYSENGGSLFLSGVSDERGDKLCLDHIKMISEIKTGSYHEFSLYHHNLQ